MEAKGNKQRSRSGPVVDRRELPRFPLRNETAMFPIEGLEKVFAILDLSQAGIAIELAEYSDVLLFPLGETMPVALKFGGERFHTDVVVRRQDAASVGFSFLEPSEGLKKQIGFTLDPLRIAASLRLMPLGDNPLLERQGITRWYHGEMNTDLYLWMTSDEQLQRVLLTWNAFVWEWAPTTGVRTGSMLPTFQHKQEIHYDPKPVHLSVFQARKILENAPVLEYRHVDFLLRQT